MDKNVSEKLCEERRDYITSNIALIVDNFKEVVKSIKENNENQLKIIYRLEKETDVNTLKVVAMDKETKNQKESIENIHSKIHWLAGLFISAIIGLGLSLFRYFLNK